MARDGIGDLGQQAGLWMLRDFEPQDQHAARTLILNGLGEHFGFIDPSLNPDLDDIRASYGGAGHRFLVAIADGAVVGTGALRRESSIQARMVRVSVAPALRRHGLGRAIVEELTAIARAQGLHRIVVETNHDWYPAIGLYRHCGFAVYDSDPESVHLVLSLR